MLSHMSLFNCAARWNVFNLARFATRERKRRLFARLKIDRLRVHRAFGLRVWFFESPIDNPILLKQGGHLIIVLHPGGSALRSQAAQGSAPSKIS